MINRPASSMNTKKILFILNDLTGGGAERVFVNIANNFTEQGIGTEILLGRQEGVYLDILDPAIAIYELRASNFYQYFRKLRRFLRDNNYTHIFTASNYISAATILAKKKLKFPAKIIATLHYDLPYQLSILPLPQRILVKYLNKEFISKADKIVAVSKGVAEGFIKIIGVDERSDVKVIFNPVFDDSIYQKGREKIAEGIFDKGKITLINAGRLEEQKNHRLLIRAFQLLLANRENMQLLIIGQGSLDQELKNLVNELGLERNVHLIGFKQNPYAYMAQSDLFVLSSSFEGLPTVLIEAMALGVNVVSTDCPSGPAEILEQGKYGWLAKNNDAVSLATAIEQGLMNRKDASFLQERAKLFHKKNIIPQYVDLLN